MPRTILNNKKLTLLMKLPKLTKSKIALAASAAVGLGLASLGFRALRHKKIESARPIIPFEQTDFYQRGAEVKRINAWSEYMHKNKGANPSVKAMNAISELSELYMPKEMKELEKIERTVQILRAHAKNPKLAQKIEGEIRRLEIQIQAFGEVDLRTKKLKSELLEKYNELLIVHGFVTKIGKE